MFNPKLTLECQHKADNLGYNEFFSLCESNKKKKLKQIVCPHCDLWIWEDWFFDYKKEDGGNVN